MCVGVLFIGGVLTGCPGTDTSRTPNPCCDRPRGLLPFRPVLRPSPGPSEIGSGMSSGTAAGRCTVDIVFVVRALIEILHSPPNAVNSKVVLPLVWIYNLTIVSLAVRETGTAWLGQRPLRLRRMQCTTHRLSCSNCQQQNPIFPLFPRSHQQTETGSKSREARTPQRW